MSQIRCYFPVTKPLAHGAWKVSVKVACALKTILAVSVSDKPGNLHKLTTALAEKNINIIDAYGFVLQPNKVGVCCLEIENLQDVPARKIVEDAGFTVLEDEELYNL